MTADPLALIPPLDPVPLPLPVAVLKALLLTTFGLHILAVDIGVGGSVVCLVLGWKGKTSAKHAEIARAVSFVLPPAVTFAITLGIAPLLFVQLLYGRLLYSSSILMAAPWLSFIFALIAGYALLYTHTGRLQAGRLSLPIGIASTLLLLWLGFLWTNNATLMLRPDHWSEISRGAPHGGALNLGDPQVVPRFLHMLTAMTAVAALMLGTASAYVSARAPFDRAVARSFGLRLFAWLTLLQQIVGPLVLFLQPPEVRADLLASTRVLAFVGIGSASALAASLTALKGADPATGRRGALVPFVLIHVTVAAMVLLRDAVRDITLARAGFAVEAASVKLDLVSTAAFAVAAALLVLSFRAMLRWLVEGRGGNPAATVKKTEEVVRGG